MLEQKQTQGIRWRKLTLPLSLSVVGTLLLLYVFSTHVVTESGIFSLDYPPDAIARQATPSNEDSACQSANPLVKDTGSVSGSIGLVNSHWTRCDLLIKSMSSQETVPPGSSARYKLIVKNIGQYDGALTLAATSQREWPVEIVPSSPLNLPASKFELVSVYHSAPAHAPGGAVDVVTVTGTMYCESPFGGSDIEVITLTTEVEPDCVLSLEPNRSAQAVAGETVHFTHTLTNKGDASDVFGFEATSAMSWPVTLPAPVSLEPRNSAVVTISVAVPLWAERGQLDTVVITATSTSLSDAVSVTDQIQITKSACDVALSIDEPDQSAAPGESVTYTLTASNTGAYTGWVEMKVNTPAGWPFDVTSPPTPTKLLPGGFDDWLLSLTVPLYEKPADKTSYITAELHCTEISRTSEVSRNVTTTVLAVPMADIEPGVVKTILVTQDIFDNGAVVSFTHAVTNVGNVADIFNFTVHSEQEWTVEEPESLALEPLISKTVTFSVTVPPRIQAISDTLTITATPQSAPDNYDTAVDWIKLQGSWLFLPVVLDRYSDCPITPLCNSDFETGSLPPCWQAGGEVAITPCPWGGRCALLGRPDPAYGCYSVPINTVWLEQTFSTPGGSPNDGHPRLSFRYEINTREHRGNDSFEVYLYAHGARYPIVNKICAGPKVGCINPPTVIHRRCEIDLAHPTDCDGNPINADLLCTEVTLRFENHNGVDNWYNTWTYVSEIEFTW